MNIPILCLIFAALTILLTKVPLAMAMAREEGGYDNRHPRSQQAGLTGFGGRALASHQNTLEAFPVFAAGLLAALWSGADGFWVNILALTFVAARVVYTILYLANLPVLRSLVWSVGFGASVALMALALF